MGADTAGQFVCPDMDDIAAGTFNMLLGEEARLRLRKFSATGTFNHKFRHRNAPFLPSFLLF